jgi:peptidoglycan/LPS O-acetylase OafA/YrhL
MAGAIGLPATFALAVLSYVLIERHFMRTGEARAPVPRRDAAPWGGAAVRVDAT